MRCICDPEPAVTITDPGGVATVTMPLNSPNGDMLWTGRGLHPSEVFAHFRPAPVPLAPAAPSLTGAGGGG